MSLQTVENRTFDEIQVGDSAELSRTLSENDIELFAATTGDANPTHLDPDFAREGGHEGIVGHSMWGGTLFSNLLGNVLPGAGTVYRSQTLRFHRPVAVGDTLKVTVVVTEKRPDDGVVVFDCHGENQHGEPVLEGTAEVLAPTRKSERPREELSTVTLHRHDAFARIISECKDLESVSTVVAHPCSASALEGALDAAGEGLISPILVGPRARIEAVAAENGLDLADYPIVDVEHSHASAARAVELARSGEAEILMKGSLHTDELMSEVASSATGLRTERRISHVFLMDVPTYPRPLAVTDAAINIFPDVGAKRDICQNAIDLAHVLGVEQPRVAILSAVETINPKIPSTMEAAALCKMADRGQITGALLDGPLAMDNAISKEAAVTKGIDSPVAGEADILLAPDLEAGNILAKQLTFLANADAAGLVLGARVPIVLTSRADGVRARLASCAVAVLVAHARRGTSPRKSGT